VNISGNAIDYSPYEAFEMVSGGGSGYAVSGLNFTSNTVNWTGATVFQAETTGSAQVSGLTAANVKVAGSYDYGYPNNNAGTFAINQGSGNSGWSTSPVLTAIPAPTSLPPTGPAPGTGTPPTSAPPTTTPPTTAPPSGTDLALHAAVSDTGHTQNYTAANTVDGDANSYWESADNAFPQSLTVDLGATRAVGRLVLKLPPATAWSTRTETFSVLGSTDNAGYATLSASAGHTFDPGTGNTVTITLPSGTSTRYLRLTFTGNTGWAAGQLSELEVYTS
jgi:hypothetical protein